MKARFVRTLDADTYVASVRWSPGAAMAATGPHAFLLSAASGADVLAVTSAFSATAPAGPPPTFDDTHAAARAHWNRFWSTGGAIDLSGSTDPRWRELERRIVLSQYLTAIQCAGRYPPQESGLTFNSWEGKFHPRDALVARGAIRAVGSPAAARETVSATTRPSFRKPERLRPGRATPARGGRR